MAADERKKVYYVADKWFRDFDFLEGIEPATYKTGSGKDREGFCKGRCTRCVSEKLDRIDACNASQLSISSIGRAISVLRAGVGKASAMPT